jgi:hypothetical protein
MRVPGSRPNPPGNYAPADPQVKATVEALAQQRVFVPEVQQQAGYVATQLQSVDPVALGKRWAPLQAQAARDPALAAAIQGNAMALDMALRSELAGLSPVEVRQHFAGHAALAVLRGDGGEAQHLEQAMQCFDAAARVIGLHDQAVRAAPSYQRPPGMQQVGVPMQTHSQWVGDTVRSYLAQHPRIPAGFGQGMPGTRGMPEQGPMPMPMPMPGSMRPSGPGPVAPAPARSGGPPAPWKLEQLMHRPDISPEQVGVAGAALQQFARSQLGAESGGLSIYFPAPIGGQSLESVAIRRLAEVAGQAGFGFEALSGTQRSELAGQGLFPGLEPRYDGARAARVQEQHGGGVGVAKAVFDFSTDPPQLRAIGLSDRSAKPDPERGPTITPAAPAQTRAPIITRPPWTERLLGTEKLDDPKLQKAGFGLSAAELGAAKKGLSALYDKAKQREVAVLVPAVEGGAGRQLAEAIRLLAHAHAAGAFEGPLGAPQLEEMARRGLVAMPELRGTAARKALEALPNGVVQAVFTLDHDPIDVRYARLERST